MMEEDIKKELYYHQHLFSDPKKMAGLFLVRNNFQVTPTYRILDEKENPVANISDKFILFVKGYKARHAKLKGKLISEFGWDKQDVPGIPALTSEERRAALTEIIREKAQAKLEILRQDFACEGDDLDELEKFVNILTGNDDEADLYALAHSLWMVKRGLFDLRRSYHHMLVFTGKQGIGKSTAIEMLTEPLKIMRRYTNIGDLSDSSSVQSFSTYLIHICEELAGHKKSDIETLKDTITNNSPSTRLRYEAFISEFTNRATFFGSSNNPIATIFPDSTGMRRFFELKCDDDLQHKWAQLRNIDYRRLWLGIDENLPNGYVAGQYAREGALVAAKKDLNTRIDTYEAFFDHHRIEFDTKAPNDRFVSNGTLVGSYKAFLKSEGLDTSYALSKASSVNIGMRLADLGFEKGRQSGGQRKRGWLVNRSATIGGDEHE